MNDLQKFTNLLEGIAAENKLYESTMALSESQEFIYAHRDELVKQYPDQWIAVHRKEVIGHNKDLLSLVRELRKSGLPLQNIALEMLGTKDIPVVLQRIF